MTIGVQVVKGLTELSQRTIEPVCPDRVSKALVEPVQIVVPPVTDPPTVVGLTVIVTLAVVAEAQTPLVETAL